MEFIVFTDESSITGLRYPSISAFSMPYSSYSFMNQEYSIILRESGVKEFKWSKLKSSNYYQCAIRIIEMIFACLFEHQLRIDILTWDTHDSRHTIKYRDDILNYERMFFHLLKSSLKRRLKDCTWHIRPDERGGIDWSTIHDCLSSFGRRKCFEGTLWSKLFSDSFFKVKTFQEMDSKKEILIQIPDLFSGMASYSRLYYPEYQLWRKQNIGKEQLSLFEQHKEDFSNKKLYGNKVIYYFDKECKRFKIGVSLENNKCLYTYDPSNPINFWHYKPQGDYDRAPTRK